MFQNMFDRLLALFMAVILLMVAISGAFSMLSIRSTFANAKMENLLSAGREIAYLASRMDGLNYPAHSNTTMNVLQWKAEQVNQDFGAYIMILDKSGRIMDNMSSDEAAEAFETLDSNALSEVLHTVLNGEEVHKNMNSRNGTVLTIAVPWKNESGETVGAVFIHTQSQTMESEYHGLLLQISIGFALSAIAAMIGTVFYTRGIVKPLTSITHAAEEMSRGKLDTRANITGVAEVRQLAGAFNVMAEKLEQVEETRREFVANVSHELRSPVTSIHGFVEGMLDGTIPLEDYREYLQIVFDETSRMKRLISDLLQLTRMDKGVEKLNWSDFDINELLRRILIERMNNIDEKQIDVQIQFYREPCIVHADSDRISQVIHNIIDNALKFVPENGRISIYTSLMHDNVVGISIQNSGTPIAESDRIHIFERFFKVDKAHTSGQGTGLGLSICQQIMEMHNQKIEALPREEGACFRFTLQLTKREELPKLEASTTSKQGGQ